MKWQTIVALLVAVPVLALFGGIGFLAYEIGQSWDQRSTDSLIAGLVATCGGGAVVIGVLLSLIVGIPFAVRLYERTGQARREWDAPAPRVLPSRPALPPPAWDAAPPLIEEKAHGAWESRGAAGYDLWDDGPAAREWQDDEGWG